MKLGTKLSHDLHTDKYTTVHHENRPQMQNGAPHHFEVRTVQPDCDPTFGNLEGPLKERVLAKIDFQNGPINEVGVNGVMNEDLIAMVITRLEHFNKTDFQCRENSMAITKLEEAMLWLRKRTIGRENRGIEGTHKV